MKTASGLLILIAVVYSCTKQQKSMTRITGEWNLSSFKRTDNEGLINYIDASGTAEFGKLDKFEDSSDYNFNLIKSFGTITDTLHENGTYKLTENGDFMYLNETDASANTLSYIKYRILTLTKTDLEIEFSKNSNTDILLFRRN